MEAVCRTVRHFLEHELGLKTRGQKLLLAVSGGADSLALLHVLVSLRKNMGHEVHVAHVNHGLRPESPAEARHVAKVCAARSIPCTVLETDVRAHAAARKMGIEEAARQLRYGLLEKARQDCEATWICTGHHSGDLEEDMLMRLVRGTGWPALGGMTALDGQRRLLRPLLLTNPEVLRELLRREGIVWVEDSSNSDTRFTRNRMRCTIVPALHAENPAFADAAQQLWRMAQDDAGYWENLLYTLCQEHGARFNETSVLLPASLLHAAGHRSVRMRLYLLAVRHLSHGQARACTLRQLDEAWLHGRGNTAFQLPGHIHARLKQGSVVFYWGREDS